MRFVDTQNIRELRRARIVITVKRTESYERWLEENPLQAIIAGDDDDDDVVDDQQGEKAAGGTGAGGIPVAS